MKLWATPAVVAGKPATARLAAAAGLTAMPDSVPAIVDWARSATAIDCEPAVRSVALKTWMPGVGGRERVVGGQPGLDVGAGEMDCARIAGGDVAEGVEGRDGEAVGDARP